MRWLLRLLIKIGIHGRRHVYAQKYKEWLLTKDFPAMGRGSASKHPYEKEEGHDKSS